MKRFFLGMALLAATIASPGVGFAQAPQKPDSVVPAIDEGPTKAHDYDWMARHQAVLDRVKKGNVGVVMIGDSITHIWGGDPLDPGAHGRAQDLWDKYLAPRNAVNLGFGWDRTQHVLWRLDHGEIDGIQPKVAVIMIGTNNIGDSVDDIVAGVTAVVQEVRHKLPHTKVLLLGIFPRGNSATDPLRDKIKQVNARLAELGKQRNVTFLDFGDRFLDPDGTLSKEIMPDYLHPSHRGYEIWAEQMEPALAKLMGEKPR
jgi:beta-glucosidase